uniref:Uncharacterized protein n=1 Tax=Physcomitrium patens TaxID=3218 RepID=A0A2K1IA80_PHYPA|nr:hypothetical protein PHYPA_030760 [Physcomitrium patens]
MRMDTDTENEYMIEYKGFNEQCNRYHSYEHNVGKCTLVRQLASERIAERKKQRQRKSIRHTNSSTDPKEPTKQQKHNRVSSKKQNFIWQPKAKLEAREESNPVAAGHIGYSTTQIH